MQNIKVFYKIKWVIELSLLLALIGCEKPEHLTLIKEKGLSIQTGEQIVPHLTNAGDGRFWVSWYSGYGSGYHMRLNLFSENGDPIHGDNGLLISDKPSAGWVKEYELRCDNEYNALLSFTDKRTGKCNIQAYKITQEGSYQWTDDGINLSHNNIDDGDPHTVVNNKNEFYVVWDCNFEESEHLLFQKVAVDGTLPWGNAKIIFPSSKNVCEFPQLLLGNNESLFLTWIEAPTSMDEESRVIYMLKFDENGNPQWPAKITVSNGLPIPYYRNPLVVSDNEGGAFIGWQTFSKSGFLQPFVQHLNTNGELLFTASGIPVTDSSLNSQVIRDMAFSEATGELVILWAEYEGSTSHKKSIFIQGINSHGERRWNRGFPIAEKEGTSFDPLAVRDCGNGVAVFWRDTPFNNSIDSRVLACRINLTAAPSITPDILADFPSVKVRPQVSQLLNNGFWVVWSDNRSDNGDIYGSFWPIPKE